MKPAHTASRSTLSSDCLSGMLGLSGSIAALQRPLLQSSLDCQHVSFGRLAELPELAEREPPVPELGGAIGDSQLCDAMDWAVSGRTGRKATFSSRRYLTAQQCAHTMAAGSVAPLRTGSP